MTGPEVPPAEGLQPAALGDAERAAAYLRRGDITKACSSASDALRHLADLDESDQENRDRTLKLVCGVAGQMLSFQLTAPAARLALAVLESARVASEPLTLGCAYWNASIVNGYLGATDLAVARATSAIELIAQAGTDRQLAACRSVRAWLLIRCDPPRLDEAEHELELARETHAGSPATLRSCDQTAARIALARGDAAAAARIAEATEAVEGMQAFTSRADAPVAWQAIGNALAAQEVFGSGTASDAGRMSGPSHANEAAQRKCG